MKATQVSNRLIDSSQCINIPPRNSLTSAPDRYCCCSARSLRIQSPVDAIPYCTGACIKHELDTYSYISSGLLDQKSTTRFFLLKLREHSSLNPQVRRLHLLVNVSVLSASHNRRSTTYGGCHVHPGPEWCCIILFGREILPNPVGPSTHLKEEHPQLVRFVPKMRRFFVFLAGSLDAKLVGMCLRHARAVSHTYGGILPFRNRELSKL